VLAAHEAGTFEPVDDARDGAAGEAGGGRELARCQWPAQGEQGKEPAVRAPQAHLVRDCMSVDADVGDQVENRLADLVVELITA